jgi:hypothetical protein
VRLLKWIDKWNDWYDDSESAFQKRIHFISGMIDMDIENFLERRHRQILA